MKSIIVSFIVGFTFNACFGDPFTVVTDTLNVSESSPTLADGGLAQDVQSDDAEVIPAYDVQQPIDASQPTFDAGPPRDATQLPNDAITPDATEVDSGLSCIPFYQVRCCTGNACKCFNAPMVCP